MRLILPPMVASYGSGEDNRMKRIEDFLMSGRNYLQSVGLKRMALFCFCLTLLLVVAILWTGFFFVIGAGLVGAALAHRANQRCKKENPALTIAKVFGVRRFVFDLWVSGGAFAAAVLMFLQGIYTTEDQVVFSLICKSLANGLFVFSASYFVLSSLRIEDAKIKLSTCSAEQAMLWRKEASIVSATKSRSLLHGLWSEA